MDVQTTQLDTNALLTQYLNVVNRAIRSHKDKVPFKQILDVAQKALAGKRFGVAVYKTDPDKPHDYFTLVWRDGGLAIADHGKKDVDLAWRVKEDHLTNVVTKPEPFVDNPARLDLDWLKTRLGL